MKTCVACKETKPLDAFGWRYKGTPKEYHQVKCKKCRNAVNNRFNMMKREDKLLRNEVEETPMPCDMCAKKLRCEVECASFRCWSEHGV